jgi:hypothetical protein
LKIKKQIEYQYSIPVFIGSSLILLLLACGLFFTTYILIKGDFHIMMIVFIWLLYGLLFLDTIPKAIKKGRDILTNTPALILTNEKLIDNTNNLRIQWTEIKAINEFLRPRFGTYIAFSLKNPGDYLKKEKGLYNRTIMRLNGKYWNGSYAINPGGIKCKKKELLKSLQNYRGNENNYIKDKSI